MCTQQLIWCSCGHGEFLPIEKCAQAVARGYCWTVVWGDGVEAAPIALPCSYCKEGWMGRRALGSAVPSAAVAKTAVPGVGGRTVGDSDGIGGVGNGKATGMFTLPLRPAASATKARGTAPGIETSSVGRETDPPASMDETLTSADITMDLDQQPVDAFALDPGLLPPTLLPPTPPPDWDDILGTDFSNGFDLSNEMWHYA
ncbi:hypothetical protein LTR53_004933 [Teratosphaeriaceae sp. CCFEE 6253]|nr:hypothetical protein LTR53_004933 [Teratosphaeriaceae sp. CCFEE 6253]